MDKKFAEYGMLNLADVAREVLEKWDGQDVFGKSVTEREGCPSFVFYEGPPSANGMPGIHHVMARSIKDTFCRYKTMKGFRVARKAGWDTHGLPVELGVEKLLGITKEDIGKTISVDDYNRHCREEVMKYTKEWTDLTHKMGYWVDLDHPYITYDNRYIETLWWLLRQLYDQNLLYKGYTIQPYSPAAGTGLSSHELNQPGCYRDVKDTTVTAQFKVLDKLAGLDNLESLARLTRPDNPEKPDGPAGLEGPDKLDGLDKLAGLEGPDKPTEPAVYILAWTTTPWTLPSNTALCVGPKIDYVAVKGQNPYTKEEAIYILAEARLAAYFKSEEDYEVLARMKGTDLVGLHYEQLFPWVKPCALENGEVIDREADAFRVIPGDYVTTEDGTGIVHIAPTFGADDAKVAKDAGIPSLFMIDKAGDTRPMVDFTGKYFVREDLDGQFVSRCVRDSYWKHSGDFVKNAYDPKYAGLDEKELAKTEDLNIVLCMEMKQEGTAFKIEKHIHNYPHCWRTDKPVLYYPLDSWFIRSTARKEEMMELNKTILWKPESTGTGRFGKWLENLNDWNLSRSRYWGTPLPIWRNAETREEMCIGSVEELYNEMEKSVAAGFMQENPYKKAGFVPGVYTAENYSKIDLHRPYVDDIVLCSPTGKPMKREADLIDVWFDSGAMPFAQMHYPFENKELVDSGAVYPADFIAEGVDQTRGWFFTLHAISTMVKHSVAYKAVISNGLVLDKNGAKMSKRLGNAVDPFGAIGKYGADAVRWYMITNSSPWDNLKFDEKGVTDVIGKFFGTLHNTYRFFAPYANLDGFRYAEREIPVSERPEIDRWILSELNSLIRNVDACYADYEPTKAGRLISDFVTDNLSNWYVRLCRKRFWGAGYTDDKLAAYQTLYVCLETVARLMAPIAPFYADKLYTDLVSVTGRDDVCSVHLARFPEADESIIDRELELRMELAQKVSSMGLALRKKENIIVKQPLQKLMIPATGEMKTRLETVGSLIKNEVNVKEIDFVEGADGILVKKVKCNFKVLGKKFGPLMKQVAVAVASMTQAQIAQLEADGHIALTLPGTTQLAEIEADEVEIYSEDIPGWVVANEGVLTVALDIVITDELRLEGLARELVSKIQNIRKASGFEISDRIRVRLTPNEKLDASVAAHRDWICGQVLANNLTTDDVSDSAEELVFDEFTVRAEVEKI